MPENAMNVDAGLRFDKVMMSLITRLFVAPDAFHLPFLPYHFLGWLKLSINILRHSLEMDLIYPDGITSQIGLFWQQVRAPFLVPFMRIMVFLCLAMSLMLFVERVYMGIVIVFIKLLRQKPEKKYKWEPIKDDLELANSSYLVVLVQIPMYNEREAMVEQECKRWAGKGVNIKYEIRDDRKGYKAGALKEGVKHNYVKMCDFVAIFDADFQPEFDFLLRTVPFLVHNPEIGLVQARWKFGKRLFP
ncbi:hypothetical protein RND71_025825 [Anisodus tanguticus]|uniref:Glycosyltransferase 2-like domain-containing protein n=1 Tax=Anisodus tanguticus TaxID=243964 RepID=A0AAE1RMB5_9SOLA|nr:hypothetical protein RND71_025825 [Anisodus tanguticus]